MSGVKDEIMEFIMENDVKFIRLQFCDIFGRLKNIAIMPSQLERAFDEGIGFDASAIQGFLNVEESDLFLIPDPSTISVLPWRPQQGRVVRFFCNIKRPSGETFEGDTRHILKRADDELKKLGFSCKVGPECEFYLMNTDEKGVPILEPHDKASYFDVAPLDKGENVRREICLTLEEMGITPESSHHETGPGQHEIDFMYDTPLTSADNLITFKSVVKTIAAKNGLFASFMPKPIIEYSGSGLHINISLSKNGVNIFDNFKKGGSAEAESFVAGILDHIEEMTLILNPTVNSYKRFGQLEAPKYITWSYNNRSPLIRVPASRGEGSRIELRSPDPSCNPYLAFALAIFAGIDGINRGLKLLPGTDINIYSASSEQLSGIKTLPLDLKAAKDIFMNSEFCRNVMGDLLFEKYITVKESEWNEYELYGCENSVTDFELNKYFYTL